MPKTGTYALIASNTVSGSSTSTVTFSSITGTFTDLVLIIQGTLANNGASPTIQFNGDTGTNYSLTYLRGTGTSAVSGRASSISSVYAGYGTGFSSTLICDSTLHILDYANTTTNKTIITRINNANGSLGQGTESVVGLWRSTSAINSIAVKPDSGNFNSGTTLYLYGILAGNA